MNGGDYSLKTPFSLKYCSLLRKKESTKKKNPVLYSFYQEEAACTENRTVTAKIASYIIDQHEADNGKQVLIRAWLSLCTPHWCADNWLQLDFLYLNWSFEVEIKNVITLAGKMRCQPEGKFITEVSPSSLVLHFLFETGLSLFTF